MKALLFLLAISSQAGLAAVYTMDLSGASVGDPVDGLDGWTQSEANYQDTEVYPRSFVTQMGSSNALSIGGYYDSEDPLSGSSIWVSRALGLGISSIDLGFDFTLTDSDDFDVDRNRFSFSFRDAGGAELWGLHFLPVSQSGDPVNETGTWNLQTSAGGVLSSSGVIVLSETGVYSLSFLSQLSTTPGDVDWSLSISGSNTFTTAGSLAGSAGAIADSMEIAWLVDGSEAAGDGTPFGGNYLTVGGLDAAVAVPEPSAAIFAACSALGLLVRRRRP